MRNNCSHFSNTISVNDRNDNEDGNVDNISDDNNNINDNGERNYSQI